MATLRLFAGLKEVAGTGSIEVSGATVGEVLEVASARFGPTFAAGVPRARVWVNGEEASTDHPVGAGDEVALLPPVSGGSGVMTRDGQVNGAVLPALIGVALLAAAVYGGEAWLAAAVVGAVSLWTIDVASVMSDRGRYLPVVPPLVTMLGGVVAVRLMGAAGLAVAAALAVIAPMAWGVVSETSRLLQAMGPSTVVSLLAGLASSSLLAALFDREDALPESAIQVFLVVAALATVVAGLAERLRDLAVGDPFVASAIAAVVASAVSSFIWDDIELPTALFLGVILAVALVAGRAFGTILRTHTTSLVERPPGLAWAVDGTILAAAVYHPVLSMLT
jgi:molybdopterin synthase sulfur carrier subunit